MQHMWFEVRWHHGFGGNWSDTAWHASVLQLLVCVAASGGAKNSAQGQAGQSLKQPLLPKAQDDVLDEIAEDWRNLPWFQVGNPLAKAETDDPDEVDPGPGPSVKAFKNNLRLAARTGLFCLLCATAVFLPGIYEQIDPNYGAPIHAHAYDRAKMRRGCLNLRGRMRHGAFSYWRLLDWWWCRCALDLHRIAKACMPPELSGMAGL
eukprot:3697092-Amphidinium_carterae.2